MGGFCAPEKATKNSKPGRDYYCQFLLSYYSIVIVNYCCYCLWLIKICRYCRTVMIIVFCGYDHGHEWLLCFWII